MYDEIQRDHQKFIPIAENAGLIHSLGNVVLLKTLDKCIEWDNMGIFPIKVAVNVSPLQFKDKNLISVITEKTQKLKNCKNSLQIELTESVLMGNLAIRSYDIQHKEKKVDGNGKERENITYPGRYIKLMWHGPNMRITNFDEANQFVKRSYREGWSLGV